MDVNDRDQSQLELDFDLPTRRLTISYAIPSPRWIRVRYQLEDRLGDEVWGRDNVVYGGILDQLRSRCLEEEIVRSRLLN